MVYQASSKKAAPCNPGFEFEGLTLSFAVAVAEIQGSIANPNSRLQPAPIHRPSHQFQAVRQHGNSRFPGRQLHAHNRQRWRLAMYVGPSQGGGFASSSAQY